MSKKIKKAILPVGGLGTRFLPATKTIPKEMLPVLDKPLVQYAVEEALEAGIEEFIFVTGRGKSAIEDYFDHSIELEKNLKDQKKDKILNNIQNMILNLHTKYYRKLYHRPEYIRLKTNCYFSVTHNVDSL